MTPPFAPSEVAATVRIMRAVADAIRELSEVPSGHLYAQLSGFFTLEQYQQTIDFLVKAKLISVTNHLIKWEGPR